MFQKLVCFLLLAFINIMHCVSLPFNGDSTSRTMTTYSVKHSQHLQEIYNNQQKLYREHDSTQVHELPKRSKRGIVLIDEDFDVTPDTRVMEDKGVFDKNVDSIFKTTPRVYSVSEESGSSEATSDDLTLTKSFMTPRTVQITKVLDHKTTAVTGGTISTKKSTRFAAPYDLDHIPRLLGQEATTGADEDIESSGDGESSIVTDSSRTTMDENASSEYTTPSTEGPDETSSSRYTTDEDISSSHVVDVTETSKEEVSDVQEELCLNITCDSKDLLILPNLTKVVPEGTNLTISCISPNATEQGLLKWYKYNSSDLLLLEENSGDHSVHFAITSTVLHHTGTYICYKFTEQFCCSKKLKITVYKVPNYKKHLIVIGVIAAASLLLCILFGICKCMRTKNYEKKVDLQNVEKPFLL